MALTKVTGELVDIGDLDISNVGSIQLDSIAGDADTNTTIAFPGSDVITMSTGGSERLRVDASGRLFVGQTASSGVRSTDPEVQVSGTDLSTSSLALHRYQANAYGPYLHFAKSRNGTVGSHTIVQDGDVVGALGFYPSDGNDFVSHCAEIVVQVDGTPGSDDVPGRIIFKTTADGAAASTERMRITSAGEVGIGTASPARELHVHKASSGATSTSNSVLVVEDDDNTELSILGGSSSVLAINFGHSGDNDEGIISFNTTSGSEELGLSSSKDITYKVTSTNSTAGHHIFKSYNTEIMRIDGGTNHVGIGATSPDTELHVAASNSSAGTLYTAVGSGNVPSITIQNSSTTDDVNAALFFKDNSGMRASIGARFVSHASGDQKAQLRFSVTGSGTTREKMVLTEDGNLSLGAETANHKIEAHSGAVASKYDGDHHVAIRGLSGGQYIQYSSANPLEFVSIDTYPNSGATSRARLTTNGHWLVGTNSSTINSSNFGVCLFADGRPKTSKNVDGGSHVMNVYGNAGEFRVYGDGDVLNTNNSYGQISDVSLKENIVDATSKLADINKVKVRNFNFIGDDLKQIGVIAQELETIFPSLVTIDEEEDVKTVKYSVFVPILIKALQEADDKIDALEARIATLESS